MHDAALLSADRIRELIEPRNWPCVTIMMPTHRAGQETRQDPIRLKNLIDRAEEQLIERGMRSPEARDLLTPIRGLHDDPDFWRHQSDGLAIFRGPQIFQPYRLPLNLSERVSIGRRPILKPLFELLTGDGRFFVLAVSQKHVRLLECSRDAAWRIEVPEMPEGREELMQYVNEEKSLQFHSGTGQTRTGTGERAAIFHGHGGPERDEKARIFEFFQQVRDALRRVLANQRAPLMFAGVEYLFPIYQQANDYHGLVETPLHGNPDRLSDAEIHRDAWSIVEPMFRQRRERAAAQFQQSEGTGKASDQLEDVVLAAFDGRIEHLFVERSASCWGAVDINARRVEEHEEPFHDDDDLLDLAAARTFVTDGTVHIVPRGLMPCDSAIAAVYRY